MVCGDSWAHNLVNEFSFFYCWQYLWTGHSCLQFLYSSTSIVSPLHRTETTSCSIWSDTSPDIASQLPELASKCICIFDIEFPPIFTCTTPTFIHKCQQNKSLTDHRKLQKKGPRQFAKVKHCYLQSSLPYADFGSWNKIQGAQTFQLVCFDAMLWVILEPNPGFQEGNLSTELTKRVFLKARICFLYCCSSVFKWVKFCPPKAPNIFEPELLQAANRTRGWPQQYLCISSV